MFEIHEDVENLASDRHFHRKEVAAQLKNKLGSDVQICENRKVLARITNTRQYEAFPAQNQSIVKFSHDDIRVNNHVETFKENASSIDMLNQACALVPYQLNAYASPISVDTLSPQDVSMLSIDSSTKKNETDAQCRQNILYTEPLYRKHIYQHLLQSEINHRPHPRYMYKQPEITDEMRCILIDWLVSISDEYDFAAETLYLAVSYIDRFLTKMSVVRSKLQLLGVTAMMIAAKYEEIHPPDINEFSSLTKETCTVRQILKMEQLVLRVLSFDLTTPTTQTFIDEFGVQCNLSVGSINMAMFLSELCLVESASFLTYLPSELAASSIALSRHTLAENEMWPRELENLCGYSLTALYPIVKKQHKVFEESPTKSLQAVRQKYNKEVFHFVSNITPRKL